MAGKEILKPYLPFSRYSNHLFSPRHMRREQSHVRSGDNCSRQRVDGTFKSVNSIFGLTINAATLTALIAIMLITIVRVTV